MSKLILAAAILLSANAVFANQSSILGEWVTEGGDSKVEIYSCGEKVCGKIIWLKVPYYFSAQDGSAGKPKTDFKNPDPKLRNRPIIGLQVMSGLTAKGENSWDQGKCYDPESGKSYRCKMKLVSPNKLDMRGYIGISLLGRDFTLTR